MFPAKKKKVSHLGSLLGLKTFDKGFKSQGQLLNTLYSAWPFQELKSHYRSHCNVDDIRDVVKKKKSDPVAVSSCRGHPKQQKGSPGDCV